MGREEREGNSQYWDPVAVDWPPDCTLSSEMTPPTLPDAVVSLPWWCNSWSITCITVHTTVGGLGRDLIWSIKLRSIFSS